MIWRFATGHLKATDQGTDLLQALGVTTSTHKYTLQVQLFAPKPKMEGSLLLPWPHTPKLCCMSSHQSPALPQAEDPAVGVAAPGKGTPFTLLSLAGVGTARRVLAVHLPSLQGGLKVLVGHLFLCHQEAPGHLGVLVDQGGQWLHLDLDHPGRSSHRHGEMKRRW